MSDFGAHPLAPDAPLTGDPVRTYLGWAVLASALCFLPLGLIAVVYGLRASSALSGGDLKSGQRLARVARRWLIATVVVGLLVDLGIVAVLLLLGAFSS